MSFTDLFFLEKTIQSALNNQRKEFDGTDEEFDKKIAENLSKIVESIVESTTSEIIKSSFKKKFGAKALERKARKKIKKEFGTGIKLFESFIEINNQVGQSYYSSCFKNCDTTQAHERLDTIIALHVRACQITSEVKTLIENGYADGAQARWRTLHELNVTFQVLMDGSNELIEMYNDYEVIENLKKAKELKANYEFLGWQPIPDEDINELENERKELINQYGKEFSRGYGWTISILPLGRRNFRELEKKVGLDYLRGFYTWANDNIHSGTSGTQERLGLPSGKYAFLNGASEHGLLDPIQLVSNSLLNMSVSLLSQEETLLNKVYIELLYFVQASVVDSFAESTKSLNEEN